MLKIVYYGVSEKESIAESNKIPSRPSWAREFHKFFYHQILISILIHDFSSTVILSLHMVISLSHRRARLSSNSVSSVSCWEIKSFSSLIRLTCSSRTAVSVKFFCFISRSRNISSAMSL